MVAGSRRSAQHDKRLSPIASIETSCGFDFARKLCRSWARKKVSRNEKNLTLSSTAALGCAWLRKTQARAPFGKLRAGSAPHVDRSQRRPNCTTTGLRVRLTLPGNCPYNQDIQLHVAKVA